MDRRMFVVALGASAGAAGAIAGCIGDDDTSSGPDPDASGPGATVQLYHQGLNEIDPTGDADQTPAALTPFVHDVSPLPGLVEESYSESGENDAEDISVTNVETTVLEQDLGATALTEDRGLGFFRVSDEQIQTIAEQNAVVDADIEYKQSDPDSADHVTATQDGDWLVVP